jgi:mono/diheme cytochrome c family protein
MTTCGDGVEETSKVGRPGRLSSVVAGGAALALAAAVILCIGGAAAASEPPVTFTRDIAPILQANCQECHHPGGIGPFSLLTYEDARSHAGLIQNVTQRRVMPPWKAAAGFGEFLDERRLSDDQLRTISRWVEAGSPQGDAKDLPAPRSFAEGWTLGKPDVALDAGQAYEVAPDGEDEYRDFVLPYQPDRDQWVTGIEVLPGSPSVVHHVVLYIDPDGVAPGLDDADDGPGFHVTGASAGFSPAIWLDSWGPGSTPRFLPEGNAWKIPAGARLVMQVHFHPDGEAHHDRTRLGLHFATSPIDKRVRTGVIGNVIFDIPPGASHHRVTAAGIAPTDITLLTVWPHMHLIGREMKVAATLPNGAARPLVWVPDWDFHWQQVFAFKEPLKLAQGSRMALDAYYDNSAGNPFNPNNPPREITFGPQSTDEMCFCFFRYTVDSEHLTQDQTVDPDGIEIRE